MLNYLVFATFALSFFGIFISALKMGKGEKREEAKWLRPFRISAFLFLVSGIVAYLNYLV